MNLELDYKLLRSEDVSDGDILFAYYDLTKHSPHVIYDSLMLALKNFPVKLQIRLVPIDLKLEILKAGATSPSSEGNQGDGTSRDSD